MEEKECIVAGIPRCGTTYLFRCLAGLPAGSGSPKGNALAQLPIIKAHSLCPPNSFGDQWSTDVERHMQAGRKAIFVFGNPVLAVISTRRKRWDRVHAANCGFFGDLRDINIYERDWFNYEMMFDTWITSRWKETLMVRYETLWDESTRETIEKFLGRSVRWNPWHQRGTYETDVGLDVSCRISETYRSLIIKVKAVPDVVLSPGRNYQMDREIAYA